MNSAELPLTFQVIEASPEVPYIGVVLKLNLKAVSQMLMDTSLPRPKPEPEGRGIAVSKVSVRLLDSLHRLVDLLDIPEDIPILAPLIHREILYFLLVGDQGHRLRQMAMSGTNSHQIGKSVQWLKKNFAKHLRVDDLAEIAGMSTSAFHQHFKTLTAMSPLQYQKWVRLHESRRLMLAENMNAGTAAFNVGYESQSQFSREYGRLFGAPPLQDIKRLRQHAAAN
jgi:AraC-like DNA-binding protein